MTDNPKSTFAKRIASPMAGYWDGRRHNPGGGVGEAARTARERGRGRTAQPAGLDHLMTARAPRRRAAGRQHSSAARRAGDGDTD